MKLTIGKPIKQLKPPKNIFRIVVVTTEGDADDAHTVQIDVCTEDEVLSLYDQYQQISKQDTDEYHHLPFFEDSIWQDQIYYNCDSGHYDSMDEFQVTWFNENSIEHTVKLPIRLHSD